MGYDKIFITDAKAYRHVLHKFFGNIYEDSIASMAPYVDGDWRVERTRIPVGSAGGFVGHTNNKIFCRPIDYAEPVNGVVSVLMYRYSEIATFSPTQRMLHIRYNHDNYDASPALNEMMRELYGNTCGGDRGNVSFNIVVSPGGIVGGTCTIRLGEKSVPDSIVLFPGNTRTSEFTYMSSSLTLYDIGSLDGNNAVCLKSFGKRARFATGQPEFIDGMEIGLW